mgnify:CR=1 FL=1
MKYLKVIRFVALSLMIILTANVCLAGDKKDMTPEQRTQKLVKLLGLDATQTVKVRAINAKYADVLGDKPDGMKKSSDAYKQRKAMRKAYRTELTNCLNKEQAKKYAKYRKDKKAKKEQEKAAKKASKQKGKKNSKKSEDDEEE